MKFSMHSEMAKELSAVTKKVERHPLLLILWRLVLSIWIVLGHAGEICAVFGCGGAIPYNALSYAKTSQSPRWWWSIWIMSLLLVCLLCFLSARAIIFRLRERIVFVDGIMLLIGSVLLLGTLLVSR